jgi:ATP phosphoribosyltransferase regulatory subunit
VEQALSSVFVQHGYAEVTLPMYEYYDILKAATHNFRDESIISFTDRTNGRQLVLRPDFTPQVCRMVAGYHNDLELPIRMFYRGTVFRNVNIDEGSKAEKYQIGCERYAENGSNEIDGDLELLLCVTACMDKIELTDYRIVLGDAAFLSRVFSMLGGTAAEYMDILQRKRLHALKPFIERLETSPELKALLEYLPVSFGGRDEFDKLMTLASFDLKLKSRCEYLKSLFGRAMEMGFPADKLVFDAGEMRGLEYYTGISFEILHSVTGELLGGGGRYDTLMEKFNLDYTACGMALHLEAIENLF